MRTRKILVIGLAIGFLSSCQVLKPATEHSKTDETSINYRTQNLNLKGAKVGTSLNIDSLFASNADRIKKYKIDSANAVASGKPLPPAPQTEKKYITDPQTKAQLSYWMDQYGKLQIGCESKDQALSLLIPEITRLTTEISKKTEIAYKTPVWCWIALSVLGTLLVISVLINVFTIKKR